MAINDPTTSLPRGLGVSNAPSPRTSLVHVRAEKTEVIA
jgi:hypothetical protein